MMDDVDGKSSQNLLGQVEKKRNITLMELPIYMWTITSLGFQIGLPTFT